MAKTENTFDPSRRDSSWWEIPNFYAGANIHNDPELYEIENLAADPDRTIEAAMQRVAPWAGKVVLDLGAGTGFHVEQFHADAAHVVAVEPDPSLRPILAQRIAERRLDRVSMIGASATDIPLRDDSVDIVHARFAYFFGPRCEPGLAEVERVLVPGGTAFIIDNDLRSGTFADWVRRGYPDDYTDTDIGEIEQFWLDQGYTIERLASRWQFERREDFERVIRLEFPSEFALQIIAEHAGLEVDYNLLLIHRTFA